jgi:hypothetical protein
MKFLTNMPCDGWQRNLSVGLGLLFSSIAFAAAPKITSFSPAQGVAGTPVQILGEGFTSTTDVLIGTEAAVFQILSDSFILATVPREASTGTIQIVTSSGITVSPLPFVGGPFIKELNPEFGAPNESIIILGRNLGNATAVHFGNDPATFIVLGDTQLSARVPNTAGLETITVTTPVAQASSETLFEATGLIPFVREFIPEFAPPGATVTVNGKNFTGTTTFQFGTTPAPFVVTADTQIQLQIPAMAPSGPVTLRNASGQSVSRVSFLVLGTAPYVEEIKPDVASPGEIVTFEGINFTGTSAVRFGTVDAEFTVTADTQIQVTIPEGAISGPPSFESINGSSVSPVSFTLNTPGPHIDDFEPLAVRGGELVRVNGRNFSTVTSVLIGETDVPFAVVADNQISITTPITPSTAMITLTNPGGITTSTNNLVITGPEPSISELIPNAGQSGDLIMIEGGNLATTTNVWFGEFEAEFSIIANNQLQAVVPNNAETGLVSVANPGGRTMSFNPFFFPVRIDQITPQMGTPGDLIEISGANFTGVNEIQFGTVIGSVTEITPHRLIAQVPEKARIGPLSITNPAGITATLQIFGIQPVINDFSPPAGPIGAAVTVNGFGFTEATEVRFGTFQASFEVRTSNQIVARVPLNTPTAPITIVNPSASVTSPEVFTVVRSADLTIDAVVSEDRIDWQQPYQVRVTVSSAGPSTVANTRVFVQLPAGTFVQSRINSHGACEIVDGLATCTLINLAASQKAEIEFTILPTYYGDFDINASLTSPVFDPTPNDHEKTLSIQVTGPVPELEAIRIEEKTFVVWPKAAANYVIQKASNLSNPTWIAIGGPYMDQGVRWAIEVPKSPGEGYYLLRPRIEEPVLTPTE